MHMTRRILGTCFAVVCALLAALLIVMWSRSRTTVDTLAWTTERLDPTPAARALPLSWNTGRFLGATRTFAIHSDEGSIQFCRDLYLARDPSSSSSVFFDSHCDASITLRGDRRATRSVPRRTRLAVPLRQEHILERPAPAVPFLVVWHDEHRCRHEVRVRTVWTRLGLSKPRDFRSALGCDRSPRQSGALSRMRRRRHGNCVAGISLAIAVRHGHRGGDHHSVATTSSPNSV